MSPVALYEFLRKPGISVERPTYLHTRVHTEVLRTILLGCPTYLHTRVHSEVLPTILSLYLSHMRRENEQFLAITSFGEFHMQY